MIARSLLLSLPFLLLGCCTSTTLPPCDAPEPPRDLAHVIDPYRFIKSFRSADYLEDAFELQQLDATDRATRLADIATDFESASCAYVLCRMLFTARPGQEFRAPMIGMPVHIASGPWPLDPIAIHNGVPILITKGHDIAGSAELPLHYVTYCLTECQWSDHKFKRAPPSQVGKSVASFIESHRITDGSADWLRRQAEQD